MKKRRLLCLILPLLLIGCTDHEVRDSFAPEPPKKPKEKTKEELLQEYAEELKEPLYLPTKHLTWDKAAVVSPKGSESDELYIEYTDNGLRSGKRIGDFAISHYNDLRDQKVTEVSVGDQKIDVYMRDYGDGEDLSYAAVFELEGRIYSMSIYEEMTSQERRAKLLETIRSLKKYPSDIRS